jgi:hypothetical protein
MAHPLTHLTHGIPTRRPFHLAKTAIVFYRRLTPSCPRSSRANHGSVKNADGRDEPGHDVERMQALNYRSKARPMRKVWNDSFRLMLTLLDGEDVQLEAGLGLEPAQVVAKPKVLV